MAAEVAGREYHRREQGAYSALLVGAVSFVSSELRQPNLLPP